MSFAVPASQVSQPVLSRALRPALAPLPLWAVQPVLKRIVSRIARDRPELFARLGPHIDKTFVIDPVNLPFVLILRPHPEAPSLRACRRRCAPQGDARLQGSFLTLLDLIDGRQDGDALFFSRALKVEGDTEAVVCLRNALDDLEGSIAEDAAALFGPPGTLALRVLRSVRSHE